MTASTGRLRDPRQRAERATRILDVTADLLLRHGHRKVSIDDVAAGAGIGKGTVYLHWKTREQLFAAVFARDVLTALDELRAALRRQPETCLPHRFAHAFYLAATARPLLRGFLLADPHLLGRLTAGSGSGREERHAELTRGWFRLLAEHGLLREDLSAADIAHAYQATFEGFLCADHGDRDTDQQAELLARTVQRAFEHDRAPGDDVLSAVATALAALLDEVITTDRAEFGLP
ncbi:TetR/AcrR family transcriptional regulator [Kitasatospora sp. NPDC048365]|uniref:TetR/AcrR family transcriptional regulator n=1 Tax=Kitasatospora sp. NPDC048365 TaxID=3364050 RepID=UPI003717F346